MITIDDDELTLTIAIACIGKQPPPDMSTQNALDSIGAEYPEILAGYRRAALAAVLYLSRCGAIDLVGVENAVRRREHWSEPE